jgi:excisionase family DNA binding protein
VIVAERDYGVSVEQPESPAGASAGDPATAIGGTTSASSYPEILTTAMAAEMLHVHVEYLRRMVREDRIPAHRFPGGREIRFVRDELIAWVRAQPGDDRSPSAAEKATT